MKKDGVKLASVIFLVLITVTMGAFGQLFLKRGLTKGGGIEINELLTKKLLQTVLERNVMTGITLYLFATALWFVILSRAELSYVYPMIALGYVVTAFLAKFYLNENITLIRWFGIMLILGGVFLITRS